jgi:hypothetical protein
VLLLRIYTTRRDAAVDLGGQALEHVVVSNLGDKDIQTLRATLVAGAVD